VVALLRLAGRAGAPPVDHELYKAGQEFMAACSGLQTGWMVLLMLEVREGWVEGARVEGCMPGRVSGRCKGKGACDGQACRLCGGRVTGPRWLVAGAQLRIFFCAERATALLSQHRLAPFAPPHALCTPMQDDAWPALSALLALLQRYVTYQEKASLRQRGARTCLTLIVSLMMLACTPWVWPPLGSCRGP